MKACVKCKFLIDSKSNFCPHCGSSEFLEIANDSTVTQNEGNSSPGESENQQSNPSDGGNGSSQQVQAANPQPSSNYQTPIPNQHLSSKNSITPKPMKWYKFLIYFGLFFGAFSNFVLGVCYLTGGIYSLQSGGQVSSSTVYAMYEGLKPFDIIYGLMLLAIAGYAIYTRYRLANYTLNAPKHVYIYYGIGACATLLYNIFACVATNTNTFTIWFFIQLIVIGDIIALNHVYFSKRNYMFVH